MATMTGFEVESRSHQLQQAFRPTRMTEATLSGLDPATVLPLFGPQDQHVRRLRDTFHVEIVHRDGQIRVTGEASDVSKATEVLEALRRQLRRNGALLPDDLTRAIDRVVSLPPLEAGSELGMLVPDVHPRTPGQRRYVEAMQQHDVVFATGPAGTGKTYLAVSMAVAALKQRAIRKIVLVRPAVEAGESLGFLPGDLAAKINPYLRPLLDSLQDLLGYDQARRLMEQDVIEVAPLAYMRGRTLNEAFIILDEAQNATETQMKMFLTRMGTRSKIVVSGDLTQVDLAKSVRSGLRDAVERLSGVAGIGFVEMSAADIVRHPLVQRIVDAYEQS